MRSLRPLKAKPRETLSHSAPGNFAGQTVFSRKWDGYVRKCARILGLLVILVGSVEAKGLWYEYEPVTAELTGVIKFEPRYGAPGFGEDPTRDKRVRICVLKLRAPINVKGTPSDDLISETVRGIREIQLVSHKALKRHENKWVRVRGKLFHAHTAHHYTKVVMSVETVEFIPPAE